MPRKNNNKQNKKKTQNNMQSRRNKRVRARGAAGAQSASHKSTGARIGANIGAILGHAAQGSIGRLFGVGEYKEALAHTTGVEAEDIAENDTPAVNSLCRPLSTNHVAMMHCDEEGTARITRREFVTFITIQTDFQTRRFDVNPGRSGTFPWLSGLATSWQQWSVQGLAFEFVPTSGYAVSSTNAALGQVIMTHYYEVTDTSLIPTAEQQLNFNGSVSCSPAATGVCYLECDPTMNNQSTYFITKVGELPSNNWSAQNYFPSIFLVTTGGAQNAAQFQAGQLWVTYDIILKQCIPEYDLPARMAGHPRFKPYKATYDKYMALKAFKGTLSYDHWVAMDAERARLLADLQKPEVMDQIRIIRASFREEKALQTSSDAQTPEVTKFLERTEYYKAIQDERNRLHRAYRAAEHRQEVEDGELVDIPLPVTRESTFHSVM